MQASSADGTGSCRSDERLFFARCVESGAAVCTPHPASNSSIRGIFSSLFCDGNREGRIFYAKKTMGKKIAGFGIIGAVYCNEYRVR